MSGNNLLCGKCNAHHHPTDECVTGPYPVLERIKELETENATLRAEKKEFWDEVDRRYSMESQEQMEDYAERIYGNRNYSMAAVIHQTWKRDPEVTQIEVKLAEVEDCLRGFIFACGREGPVHEIEMLPNFVMKAKRVLSREPKVIAVKTVQYYKHAGSKRIDIRNDQQPHMGLPFAKMILLELEIKDHE